MKKVLFNKKKFTIKDCGRITILFLIHAIGLLSYLLIVLGFNFIYKQSFFPTPFAWNLLLYYPLTLGIFVNVGLHIIYTEIGNSWIRLMMWIHTGILTSTISIIIFTF